MATSLNNKINYLNIGLIALSFALAIKLPFQLFLFAYAVLGPLHYLTEINWLKENNFFSKSVGVPVIMVALGVLITISFVSFHLKWEMGQELRTWMAEAYPALVFSALVLAVLSQFKLELKWLIVALIICLLLIPLVKGLSIYSLVFGAFLPTIIHVSLFTALFMWYGVLKGKEKSGYAALLCFVLGGLLLAIVPISPEQYTFTEDLKRTFNLSQFGGVNVQLQQVFYSFSETNRPSFGSELGIRVQAFIAYSYTYHYLNWFSKTSIIGWHKVGTKKLVISLAFWALCVSLYYYDYKIGLISLFFLSMLHVFLEFPLNIKSIMGITKHYVR